MENVNWQKVADRLRMTLEEKRMSRQTLADDARVSRKTIDRLLSGAAVNVESLRKIETALKAVLHESNDDEHANETGAPAAVLPDGAIGTFLMTRRSFDSVGRIIISALRIERRPTGAFFDEYQANVSAQGKRYEHSFAGQVRSSSTSSNLQLIAEDEGLQRVLSLSRPVIGHQDDGGLIVRMRGVLLAFNEVRQFGAVYPVATPVFVESATLAFLQASEHAFIGSFPEDAMEIAHYAHELLRAEQTHVASKGGFKGTVRRYDDANDTPRRSVTTNGSDTKPHVPRPS